MYKEFYHLGLENQASAAMLGLNDNGMVTMQKLSLTKYTSVLPTTQKKKKNQIY